MERKESKVNKILVLIPKVQTYMEYIIELVMKLPRTEKYGIGTDYKSSLNNMMEDVMMISKVPPQNRLYYINKVDARLNTQRVYLRIMEKYKWIDNKKFMYAMELAGEVGKVVGGLIKTYSPK